MEFSAAGGEIADIARDENQSASGGGGSAERVEGGKRLPARLCGRLHAPPEIGDLVVDPDDPAREAFAEIGLEPALEPPAFWPGGKAGGAFTDLAQSEDAEMQGFLRLRVEPGQHLRRGLLLRGLADDAGIEQPAHSEILRGKSRARVGSGLSSRRGEAARKRLSDSLRGLRRLNSSTDITTTAGWPWRVTTW